MKKDRIEELKSLVSELKELQAVEMYVIIRHSNASNIEGVIKRINPKSAYITLSDAEGMEHACYIPSIKGISY